VPTQQQLLERLHADVSAVCPILGVRLSPPAYDPDPSATAEQLAAADAVLAAFDPSDEAQAAWEEDRLIRETVQRIMHPEGPTEKGIEASQFSMIVKINEALARINTLSAIHNLPPIDLIQIQPARQYAAAMAAGDVPPPP
jgi:hypothetical protein